MPSESNTKSVCSSCSARKEKAGLLRPCRGRQHS